MASSEIKKCPNCGAEITINANAAFKCAYCGSIYQQDNSDAETETDKSSDAVKNVSSLPQLPNLRPPADNGIGGIGCITGIIVMVIFIAVVTLMVNSAHSGDSNAVDSLVVDTAMKADQQRVAAKNANDGLNEATKITLKELTAIDVDAAMFKKLYSNTRKKHDQFSGTNEIYDKSSPRYVNINGIFAYISTDSTSTELWFKTQYVADEWLFINTMTFNADGENFEYSPVFKNDSGDGQTWEWSDANIPDYNLSMLVKIAIAKKAKVKYDGSKYYHIDNISRKQQLALKRILQIYKGLLLGYAKR